MEIDWTELKVGDRVRVIGWPPELCRTNLHPETIRFYERLIARREILEVVRHDHFGIPYGKVEEIDYRGKKHSQTIGLNHGAIELVGDPLSSD